MMSSNEELTAMGTFNHTSKDSTSDTKAGVDLMSTEEPFIKIESETATNKIAFHLA